MDDSKEVEVDYWGGVYMFVVFVFFNWLFEVVVKEVLWLLDELEGKV